jgi:hypothetical protein
MCLCCNDDEDECFKEIIYNTYYKITRRNSLSSSSYHSEMHIKPRLSNYLPSSLGQAHTPMTSELSFHLQCTRSVDSFCGDWKEKWPKTLKVQQLF